MLQLAIHDGIHFSLVCDVIVCALIITYFNGVFCFFLPLGFHYNVAANAEHPLSALNGLFLMTDLHIIVIAITVEESNL